MGKTYLELDDRLRQFIREQRMFFVGSAPLHGDGRINISPKGMDTLRILDSKTIAYLDLTGSGIESIAHIKENGRFVFMFCSFDTKPVILRLHGKARVIERNDAEWASLQPHFPDMPTARAIIVMAINRIADSCGWGVPLYQWVGERNQYTRYAEQLDDEGLRGAQLDSNMRSLDGLPGLKKPSV